MNEIKKVVLMCGNNDCCPTVSIDARSVVIEDDFGGKVKLSKEQFAIFKKKIKKGDL